MNSGLTVDRTEPFNAISSVPPSYRSVFWYKNSVAQQGVEETVGIRRHHLAGFLLPYREIVLIAQEIMEKKGMMRPRGVPGSPPVRRTSPWNELPGELGGGE